MLFSELIPNYVGHVRCSPAKLPFVKPAAFCKMGSNPTFAACAAFSTEGPNQTPCPPYPASDGSHNTIPGNATSIAIVAASAMKNGVTPLNTS